MSLQRHLMHVPDVVVEVVVCSAVGVQKPHASAQRSLANVLTVGSAQDPFSTSVLHVTLSATLLHSSPAGSLVELSA